MSYLIPQELQVEITDYVPMLHKHSPRFVFDFHDISQLVKEVFRVTHHKECYNPSFIYPYLENVTQVGVEHTNILKVRCEGQKNIEKRYYTFYLCWTLKDRTKIRVRVLNKEMKELHPRDDIVLIAHARLKATANKRNNLKSSYYVHEHVCVIDLTL
jgi:tRNA nucleotidyltransferase/poly(A) polymerase